MSSSVQAHKTRSIISFGTLKLFKWNCGTQTLPHTHTHSRILAHSIQMQLQMFPVEMKKELQFHRQRALVWKHFELFKFLMNQKCFHTLTHLFLLHTHVCAVRVCVCVKDVCSCPLVCEFISIPSKKAKQQRRFSLSLPSSVSWRDSTKCNWT